MLFPGDCFYWTQVFSWMGWQEIGCRFKTGLVIVVSALADTINAFGKKKRSFLLVFTKVFLGFTCCCLTGALTSRSLHPIIWALPLHSVLKAIWLLLYIFKVWWRFVWDWRVCNTWAVFLDWATVLLTQMFDLRSAILLALLGPAIAAGSWNIRRLLFMLVNIYGWYCSANRFPGWLIVWGVKLELPLLMRWSINRNRRWCVNRVLRQRFCLIRIGKNVELVVGLTLVTLFI